MFVNFSRGVDSALETLITCVGHYEIKPPLYENFTEKNKCIHTKKMDSCINTKLFNLNLKIASTTYRKI